MKIMDGITEDGVSNLFTHGGGESKLNLYVSGSDGGGLITVEAQTPDGISWVPVIGDEVVGEGMYLINAAPFIGRVSLTGSTNPSLSVWVEYDDTRTKNRIRTGI